MATHRTTTAAVTIADTNTTTIIITTRVVIATGTPQNTSTSRNRIPASLRETGQVAATGQSQLVTIMPNRVPHTHLSGPMLPLSTIIRAKRGETGNPYLWATAKVAKDADPPSQTAFTILQNIGQVAAPS